MRWPLFPILALALVGLFACAPAHVSGYEPKRRQYTYEGGAAGTREGAATGSLWRADHGASFLYADPRAFRAQDVVIVRVEEVADARRSADTDVSREQRSSAEVGAFLEFAGRTQLPASEGRFSASRGTADDARGSTQRSERLTATVPAIVREVLPNGNLFIEGHRVVLVNQEEHHFYISGVIRPIDIADDNSVKSSQIAEAEVEFTGRGVLSDNGFRNPVQRVLGWLWPF